MLIVISVSAALFSFLFYSNISAGRNECLPLIREMMEASESRNQVAKERPNTESGETRQHSHFCSNVLYFLVVWGPCMCKR